MRLWSIHPSYLDTKGLVALWREALLAKAVLEGKTKGYKNHPQLERFRKAKYPVDEINIYLEYVLQEAQARGYNFDSSKIGPTTGADFTSTDSILVTEGQLTYELNHLLNKLKERCNDEGKINSIQEALDRHFPIVYNPLFDVIPGTIESWEKVS